MKGVDSALRAVMEYDLGSRERDNPFEGLRHITKIDPDKETTLESLIHILESGTDAVEVGGTLDVGPGKTAEKMDLYEEALEMADIKDDPLLFLEPGDITHFGEDGRRRYFELMKRADHLAEPTVRNTHEMDWRYGKHERFYWEIDGIIEENAYELAEEFLALQLSDSRLLEGLTPESFRNGVAKSLGSVVRGLDREDLVVYLNRWFYDVYRADEHYIVLNPESSVAEVTGADRWLEDHGDDPGEIRRKVKHSLTQHPDSIYIEYSGTFGDPELVAEVHKEIDSKGKNTPLLYGGGIRSEEEARTMYEAGVDAVVVGDFAHEDPEGFQETVVD